MAQVISVSALNTYVRSILESDEALNDIAIEGEISNYNRNYKTGHCYFSLKDAKASVKAVMFRSDAERQSFVPENGMRVVARGRVTLYERDGAFQLYVEFLFPQGQGAAQLAFEQLRARMEAEGLFAPELKKPIPAWPRCIGLITSKTGAALQDILQVAGRRCPIAGFALLPVTVQGMQAAGQIAGAIAALDGFDEVDLIIVARGGGSAEDLGVFNAEEIARAAYRCETPLISAIGHEVDYTILDFVADLRAPTPSAAAEMALPNLADARRQMMNVYMNIANNIQFQVDSWYNNLNRLATHPALAGAGGMLERYSEKMGRLGSLARAHAADGFGRAGARLGQAAKLAEGLNPYAVLARGYAAVKLAGATVSSVEQAPVGQLVEVSLSDGALDCRVENQRRGEGSLGKQ